MEIRIFKSIVTFFLLISLQAIGYSQVGFSKSYNKNSIPFNNSDFLDVVIDDDTIVVYGIGKTSVLDTHYGDSFLMEIDSLGEELDYWMNNAVDKSFGFPHESSNYAYDDNGNMTSNGNMNIDYNPLNLPKKISTGTGELQFDYGAQGTKYRKVNSSDETKTRIYFHGMEYENNLPEVYHFSGGRVLFKKEGETYQPDYFEYSISDHLGNLAVSFKEKNELLSVLQRHYYYPFGIKG